MTAVKKANAWDERRGKFWWGAAIPFGDPIFRYRQNTNILPRWALSRDWYELHLKMG